MAKRIKQYSNLTPKEQNRISKLLKKGELKLVDLTFSGEYRKGVILNSDDDELLVIINIAHIEEDDEDEDEDIERDEDELVETNDELALEEE